VDFDQSIQNEKYKEKQNIDLKKLKSIKTEFSLNLLNTFFSQLNDLV